MMHGFLNVFGAGILAHALALVKIHRLAQQVPGQLAALDLAVRRHGRLSLSDLIRPAAEIADRGFRVVGLFTASVTSFEEQFVFAGKTTTQNMLRIGDQVSEIAVLGDDYRDVDELDVLEWRTR